MQDKLHLHCFHYYPFYCCNSMTAFLRCYPVCSRMNANATLNNTMRRESGASHSVSTSGRFRQMTTMMLAESFTTLVLSSPLPWYLPLTDGVSEAFTLSYRV